MMRDRSACSVRRAVLALSLLLVSLLCAHPSAVAVPSPPLELDISISGQQYRLVVAETDGPTVLAKRFCSDRGLSRGDCGYVVEHVQAQWDAHYNMTDSVRGQYEVFPYPPRDLDDKTTPVTFPANLHEANHFLFGGKLRLDQAFRVLVVGCGTGDEAVQMVDNLIEEDAADWTVVCLDFSAASLQVAGARLQHRDARILQLRGKGRYVLHRGSLLTEDLSSFGAFHFIVAVGVLHHLPDPAAGLRALQQWLHPGTGGIGCLLYGKLGRRGIYGIQETMRALEQANGVAAETHPGGRRAWRVQMLKEVLYGLPPDHPVMQSKWWFDMNMIVVWSLFDRCLVDVWLMFGRCLVIVSWPSTHGHGQTYQTYKRTKRAGHGDWLRDSKPLPSDLYDLFLHSHDVAYTVQGIADLAAEVGMAIVDFMPQARYDPVNFLGPDASPALVASVRHMSWLDQRILSENLAPQNLHAFFLVPRGDGTAAVSTTSTAATAPALSTMASLDGVSDAEAAEYVPRMRSETFLPDLLRMVRMSTSQRHLTAIFDCHGRSPMRRAIQLPSGALAVVSLLAKGRTLGEMHRLWQAARRRPGQPGGSTSLHAFLDVARPTLVGLQSVYVAFLSRPASVAPLLSPPSLGSPSRELALVLGALRRDGLAVTTAPHVSRIAVAQLRTALVRRMGAVLQDGAHGELILPEQCKTIFGRSTEGCDVTAESPVKEHVSFRMWGLLEEFPAGEAQRMAPFVDIPLVDLVMNRLLGDDYWFFGATSYVVAPCRDANIWHTDFDYQHRAFRLASRGNTAHGRAHFAGAIIYLQDTAPGSGGTQLINGSHLWPNLDPPFMPEISFERQTADTPRKAYTQGSYEALRDVWRRDGGRGKTTAAGEMPRTKVAAGPGHILFFHGNTFHASGSHTDSGVPGPEGFRYAVVLHFSSDHAIRTARPNHKHDHYTRGLTSYYTRRGL